MSCELEGMFDPSQVAPVMGGGQSLPVSPNDGHLVVITDADWKQTQSGTGEMLQLHLQILEGPNAGVTGTWNLNLKNPNATTVRIAMQELSCICHAVGHMQAVKNVAVLFNKPFRIVVGLQKGADAAEKGYTEVKQVLYPNGQKLNKGGQPAQPAQQTFAPPQQPQQAFPPAQPAQQTFAPPQQPQQAFPQAQPAQQTFAPPQQPQQAFPPAQPAQQTFAPPQQPQQAFPQAQPAQQTFAPPQQPQQFQPQPQIQTNVPPPPQGQVPWAQPPQG